jgi:hypothetical protein
MKAGLANICQNNIQWRDEYPEYSTLQDLVFCRSLLPAIDFVPIIITEITIFSNYHFLCYNKKANGGTI